MDVATGSLGQGICAAIGTALNARRIGSEYRTYVLLGDGEMAEGSVWEAADVAVYYKLDNLCGVIDVNALGQSQHTQFSHDMDADRGALEGASAGTRSWSTGTTSRRSSTPSRRRARPKGVRPMILARTIKGKGCPFVEGKDGWHGKAFKKGEETDRRARRARAAVRAGRRRQPMIPRPRSQSRAEARCPTTPKPMPPPAYKLGDLVATREAYGTALAKLGDARSAHRRARRRREELDLQRQVREGRARSLLRELHRRAGDGRRGDGAGGARRDSVPVDVRLLPDARRRFHPHGGDQQRQRQARRLARRRVDRRGRPVADGARGSGDDARAEPNCTVLYPCDAVSTERLVVAMAEHTGPGLHAHQPAEDAGHLRERRDVHRSAGSKVLRESGDDVATVIGAGVTVFEALKAYDQLKADGHRDPRDRSLFAAADRRDGR